MLERICDICKEKVRFKYLKRIRGKSLCKDCAKDKRLARRKVTMERAGISEDIKKLDKEDRERKNAYNRKKYAERREIILKEREVIEGPKIKGSTAEKIKSRHASESFIGFQESQVLLKIIMKRGLTFDEAKEKLEEIKKQLRETREKMKKQKKTEKEIKLKSQEFLEELWGY